MLLLRHCIQKKMFKVRELTHPSRLAVFSTSRFLCLIFGESVIDSDLSSVPTICAFTGDHIHHCRAVEGVQVARWWFIPGSGG